MAFRLAFVVVMLILVDMSDIAQKITDMTESELHEYEFKSASVSDVPQQSIRVRGRLLVSRATIQRERDELLNTLPKFLLT